MRATDTIAIANARGIVRDGCATSPLAARGASIPMNENSARIAARPRLSVSGWTACTKLALSIRVQPTMMKMNKGINLSAVATLTKRAARATPAMLISATLPITPTITAACTVGTRDFDATLAATDGHGAYR